MAQHGANQQSGQDQEDPGKGIAVMARGVRGLVGLGRRGGSLGYGDLDPVCPGRVGDCQEAGPGRGQQEQEQQEPGGLVLHGGLVRWIKWTRGWKVNPQGLAATSVCRHRAPRPAPPPPPPEGRLKPLEGRPPLPPLGRE